MDMLTKTAERFLTNLGTGIYPPLVQKEQSIDNQTSKRECLYSPQLCNGCNEESICAKDWRLQEALNGRR